MIWTAYIDTGGHRRLGVVEDGRIHALAGASDFVALLQDDRSLESYGNQALTSPAEVVEADSAIMAALIETPPSVRDFMAFEDHVVTAHAAMGWKVDPDWYELPVFYFQNPAAIKAPGARVHIAPGSSKFDYELEFAVVIGKGGADLTLADAPEHIAGFMSFCDWSARDLQEREQKLTLGPSKGKDTASTLGPYLVTPDELQDVAAGNAYDIPITASVNSTLYSAGNLSSVYWSFAQMLVYASRGTELRPGDVLASGTVGTGCIIELARVHGAEKYPYLVPGDVVDIDAGVLGSFRTVLERGADPLPFR
jgi:2-keto-4-pentenoate hydratase/2-oxohepta-3-ene-1,7-dioic acid hydratase in catechol pathway